ncbi:MAG TPA: hypothetical protein VEG25_04965, partial [Burkholderiales bacterium]|nr:hypothetical protein [Burkholderiales bacterium]
MMRNFHTILCILAFLLALVAISCASPQQDSYNTFLNKIAKACDPLIIGSDNMGQAITFNGLGANNENYTTFLRQTQALYEGSMSPAVYRQTLTDNLGGGSYNDRSFNCIIAHLPGKQAGAPAEPAP